MPKKEKKDIKDIILKAVENGLIIKIKEQFDKLVDNIKETVSVAQKKIMMTITAATLALLGIIFLIISGTFALVDILGLNRVVVFLLAGIFLILISAIMLLSAKLLKFPFNK